MPAEIQVAAHAIYQWAAGVASQMYVSGTYQHIGSRFTQVGDEDLGTVDMTAPSLFNTIGGPLSQTIGYPTNQPRTIGIAARFNF